MLRSLTDLVENWTDRILEGVGGIIIETKKTQQFFKKHNYYQRGGRGGKPMVKIKKIRAINIKF